MNWWALSAVVVALVIAGLVWRVRRPIRIERIGYVEGVPDTVFCTCGSKMDRTRKLKKDNELWTEWICPHCVKGGY